MSFQETWQNATADGSNDAPPPDPGMYDVTLADARAFVSKKGEAWTTLTFRVESLRNKGHEWDVLLGYRSQKQANVAKATVSKLGVDVDAITGIEDLDAALKQLVGQMFAVEVKQNGEYRNTYVDGPVQGSQTTAPVTDATPPSAAEDFLAPPAAADPTPVMTDDGVPFRAFIPDGRIGTFHNHNPFDR